MKLELKHLAPYLPYELKCQYEGIINGREISKHKKEFEKNGEPFVSWQYYEPIQEIRGLKIAPLKQIRTYKNYWVAMCGIYNNGQKNFYNGLGLKPILRPLSDFIDINSEIIHELNYDLSTQIKLIDIASKRQHYSHCSYLTMEICFENHIDVFGLIEKGLAISVHDVCQADA